MEMPPQGKRAKDKWAETPKTGFESGKSYYDAQQCWAALIDGKTYYLEINKGNNHFAKKHILFAKDTDAVKVQAFDSEKDYLVDKAKRKIDHRDASKNNDRQMEKYGLQVITKNCLLNLKPFGEGRHIEEGQAIVCIAREIARVKDLKLKSVHTVKVDFGTNCIIKTAIPEAIKHKENNKKVSFNSWMNITFSVLHVDGKTIAVSLFHADTKQ